jgi:hypothetical protein
MHDVGETTHGACDHRQALLHRVEQNATDTLAIRGQNEHIERRKVIAHVLHKAREGDIREPRSGGLQHPLVFATPHQDELQFRVRALEFARYLNDELLTLLRVVERADVPHEELARKSATDGVRLRRVHDKPRAAAMDDAYADGGIVRAHDVGDLGRDRDHVRGPGVRSMREPVAADRVVDAPRDDVRRAADQRTQIRPVHAAAFVHVQQRDASGRPRHRYGAAGDFANLDARVSDALHERAASPRDQRLPHAAAREPPDQ